METIREKFVNDIKEILLPVAGIGIGVANPVAGAAISIVAEDAKNAVILRRQQYVRALA